MKNMGEYGMVKILPLLLIVAAVGIISFLLISSTAPFKSGLFGLLNTKPPSHADTMMMGSPFMNNDCGIPNQAFCDTFDFPWSGGGRAGQLDPTKWVVDRITGLIGSGAYSRWYAGDVQHCKDRIYGGVPDNDFFMCGHEYGESEHFMETFNTSGSFVYNDAMIDQPFDFANRDGTIIWDVDAANSGGHGWWTEVWLTDTPIPGPHEGITPANGVGIVFSGECGGPLGTDMAGAPGASVVNAFVFNNYQMFNSSGSQTSFQQTNTPDSCFKTEADSLNHMKIVINKDRLEVWATDNGDETFNLNGTLNYKLRTYFTGMNLQFSRGYAHFEHIAYNPAKAGAEGVNQSKTFHWDTIGFDGPVIPAPAHYPFPDSMHSANKDFADVGYIAAGSGTGPISVNNVNLSGVKSATLAFNIQTTNPINYSINGGPWHQFYDSLDAAASGTNFSAALPVDLSELKSGTNTVAFQGDFWNGPIAQNIDLFLNGSPNGPAVKIASPPQSQAMAPANIPITINATAQSPATSISKVELWQNGTPLATLTQAPFTFNWNNVSVGSYIIHIVVTDNNGNTTVTQTPVSVIPPTPLFNLIQISKISATGASFYWVSDKLSDSQVEYGTTTSYGTTSVLDSNQVYLHTVNVTGLTPNTTYHFRLKSRNAAGLGNSNDLIVITPVQSNLSAPWQNQDIGNVGFLGGTNFNNGVYTIQGGGYAITGVADAFQFAYQPLNGDGIFSARVANAGNSDPSAETGVMMRETNNPGSSEVSVLVTPGQGIFMKFRPSPDVNTNLIKQVSGTAPKFVRLMRQGDLFTGFYSTDGTTWTQLGTINVPMLKNINVGLAANARANTQFNTATIDNVSLSSSVPATPVPLPTPTPGTNSFSGEYWNISAATSPNIPTAAANLVRNDPAINFDWGSSSPDPTINSDGFVARWNGNFAFNAGTYTFRDIFDDGARVWVDGNLIVNHWADDPLDISTNVNLTAGTHNIRMEYYELAGGATAKLSWTTYIPTPVPTPSPTQAPTPTPGTNSFTGEYWNWVGNSNAVPVIAATLVRNDPVINFNWGPGSPGSGINSDHFVARWTGNFNFNSGNYTFTTADDDGVRVYFDNNLIIDHWVDQGAVTYTTQIPVAAGTHLVKMEYYENGAGAQAALSWAQTSSITPVPTATPSTSCPKASLGDVDCDGTIGIFDFNALISNFGKTGTGLQGDLDGNGKVDIFDFNTLVTNFGK